MILIKWKICNAHGAKIYFLIIRGKKIILRKFVFYVCIENKCENFHNKKKSEV